MAILAAFPTLRPRAARRVTNRPARYSAAPRRGDDRLAQPFEQTVLVRETLLERAQTLFERVHALLERGETVIDHRQTLFQTLFERGLILFQALLERGLVPFQVPRRARCPFRTIPASATPTARMATSSGLMGEDYPARPDIATARSRARRVRTRGRRRSSGRGG